MPDSEAAREREMFDRVRSQAKRRQETRAMALGFGLAAVFSGFMAFVKPEPGPGHANAGVILAVVFGLIAAVTFISSYFVTGDGHAV
jgi:hypothetical protein